MFEMEDKSPSNELVEMTADIVSAYVSNNSVVPADLPNLIDQTFIALKQAATKDSQPRNVELNPAVSIKKSVTPDLIICLEDGKKFKSLKRHLRTSYNLTPGEYREKWGLPYDYPMVAPNYAAQRSEMAKKIGLGRKPKS
jgi:predicted transcriptional regulator